MPMRYASDMSAQGPDTRHFSTTYDEARERFRQAACAAGATHHTYALNLAAPETLSIDVALLGAAHAPTLLLSSGVHGIEGFFGAAVQLALLERLAQTPPRDDLRYVLLHAVNPYGFARLRRVNEDNVDLNRNFVVSPAQYGGAPAGYAALDGFLNPPSPPSRWEPFRLKALWQIQRLGLQALKNAVAGGQYEFPLGLFYGGNAPSASMRVVEQHCDAWLAGSREVVHIDLHTGLGAHAQHTLLLNETRDAPEYAWYAAAFDGHHVEPLSEPRGTAYRASGAFGQWLQHRFGARDYRYHFVGAEFGTYDVIRVLAALRAENRAHHHCAPSAPAYARAKQELLECFCPASSAWRQQVLQQALQIIRRAELAITHQGARREMP